MNAQQEELSHEHSLLRTLINNLPDCIYAKDAEARKIIANPADLKNLGCKTEDEAISRSSAARRKWSCRTAIRAGC